LNGKLKNLIEVDDLMIKKKLEYPNFTIGICAYNEEKNIGKLLKKLPKNKEIIVVASGCTDKTEEIIMSFSKKNKKIKLISEKERRGKSYAISQILKKARNNLILFIDADNIITKKSIKKLFESFFSKENVGAVTGRIIPRGKRTLSFKLMRIFWFLHHKTSILYPKISGQFYIVNKKLVKSIPTKIVVDDGYINFIIIRRGYKVLYAPSATSYTSVPKTVFSIIKWRRRIIRGYMQLNFSNMRAGFPLKASFFIFLKECIKNIKNLNLFLLLLIIEIISILLATIDSIRNYVPYCWEKV